MFELYIPDLVVEEFNTFNEADKAEIRRLLGLIAQNPFWDNRTKFSITVNDDDSLPLGTSTIYESGRFTIAYHVMSNDMVWIRGIAPSAQAENA